MARFRPMATVPPRYEEDVIGLPSGAMVLTNSERRTAWCQRRWWYAQGLGIGTPASGAMHFGSCVHRAMEAAFNYYMHTDKLLPEGWQDSCPLCPHWEDGCATCPACEGSMLGPVALAQEMMISSTEELDWHQESRRLRDVIEGYFIRYEEIPQTDYKVVGVELSIAMPVISPTTGKVYRSDVYVVETPEGWQIARNTDGEAATTVSLPWYQCAKMDAVLQHRRSGDLWVHEFKTSANPQTYGRDLRLDTQIPGYMRALNHAISLGHFGDKSLRVAGYFWDVLGSRKHTKPRVLKNGKVSLAKNQRIASWHWKQMMDARDMTDDTDADIAELKQFYQGLKEGVDPTLYHREFGAFTEDDDRRYAVELFADAKRFSRMRRDVIRAQSEEDIAERFPRTPVCRVMGHGCSYTAPCLNQGLDLSAQYEERPVLMWLRASTINQPEPEEDKLCLGF